MKSKIVSNNIFLLVFIGAILISLISINDVYADLSISDKKKIDSTNSTTSDGLSLDILTDDLFGYYIENIGDLDNNGVDDLATIKFSDDVAGEPNAGSIMILFMNSNGTVSSTSEITHTDTASTGLRGATQSAGVCIVGDGTNRESTSLEQLAFVGDLDGDGKPTLALGAPDNDHDVTGSGAIYMLELNTDGTVDSCFRITPDVATHTSGFAPGDGVYLEGADAALSWPLIATDVDGDGQNELIAGASNDADDSTNFWVLFLNSTGGVDSHPDTPIFGVADLGASDYVDDGDTVDGATKIVVGVQGDGAGEGSIFVIDLTSTGAFSSSTEITGISLGVGIDTTDSFGASVAELGDMDADGINDILVGNELGDDGTANSGEAYILLMNNNSTVKESQKISNFSEINGSTSNFLSATDLFSHGMALWMDDGGNAVIAISAHGDDTGGATAGALYLFYIERISISSDVKKGGGGCDDCTPPTLGVNSHGERQVDGGFSYNDKTVNAALFHTEFPLINATIGEMNVVKIKVYENQGVQNIQNIQFGLGVQEVGKPLSLSEVIILVGLHHNGTAVELIDITDNENLIENDSVTASVDTVKCKEESYNADCLLMDLQYSYREAPKYNVMLIVPMDDKRNAWNFYFNDGIRVIGESQNPSPTQSIFLKKSNQALDNWLNVIRTDKINDVWTDDDGIQYQHNNNNFDRITPHESWTCKDKPLDEIMVPTRNNCHFRELTAIWNLDN